MVGPRALIHDLQPKLEAEAVKLGLVLNRSKCAVLVPSSSLGLPDDFLPGVPRVFASACPPVLGSPVGDTSACSAWAEDHVGKPLALALERLLALGEPRSASLILRQCFSACKVNWILRTSEAAFGRLRAQTGRLNCSPHPANLGWHSGNSVLQSVLGLGHPADSPWWGRNRFPIACLLRRRGF